MLLLITAIDFHEKSTDTSKIIKISTAHVYCILYTTFFLLIWVTSFWQARWLHHCYGLDYQLWWGAGGRNCLEHHGSNSSRFSSIRIVIIVFVVWECLGFAKWVQKTDWTWLMQDQIVQAKTSRSWADSLQSNPTQQEAFCKTKTCLLDLVRGLELNKAALLSPGARRKLLGLARDDLCKVHQAVYRSWADWKRVVWLALCRRQCSWAWLETATRVQFHD